MHEKPLKLDMGFDEALIRISKTPKASVKVTADQESNLEKIKIKSAIEQQIKTAPQKRRVRRNTL